ncbi:MAG: hypothetical protein WD512_17550 [Candidatus Paceibacterota bacterium]
MLTIAVLKRKKVHIKMRLDTAHLTEEQRFALEEELWKIENLIDNIESDDSPIELRAHSLRI